MAFTDLGTLGAVGSTGNNQTTLDLVTTAAVAAGNLVVVVVAADNIANGGDDNACSGVTLGVGGQALTKGKQIANALAAQAGASSSIWWGISTSGLASGGTIRATFGSATLVDASGLTARKFSVASDNGVVTEGTAGTLVSNTAADPGSLDVTTANIACLRVRGIASQVGNNTNLTQTASWTAWANGNSATTGTTGEICARAESLISTATGAASNPTYVSAIYASCYVAFKELPPSDGVAGGIAAATGGGGAINTTPGTAGGVAAASAVGVEASIYSAEAVQFFARTTGLTSERKALLNTYINALVAGGVWAKLQVHYLFASPDAATAIINLKSSSFPGTINGSPTFAADVGFTNPTVGITAHYIDTGYSPSVHGAQNDQHISLWNSTNQAQASTVMGCAAGGKFLQIWPKQTDNNSHYFCNTGGAGTVAVGDPRGLHIATTTGAGGQVAYFNGVASGTISGTTGTPPTDNVCVLASDNGSFIQGGNFQVRSASVGTQLSAAEAAAFFDAQYAFLAALVENIYSAEGSASGVAAASAEGRSIVAAATGGGGDWVTVWTATGSLAQNPGWVGYTLVGVIPLAAFSQTGGSSIRISFTGPFAGEASEYSAFYIGNGGGGDAYDFGATPTQVTVGSSGTITLPVDASGLSVVVSDEIAFVKDGTNSLVIAGQLVNAAADTISYYPPVTGSGMFYKGATDAATVNKSGYADISGSGILAVKTIELFVAVAGGVAGVGGALAVGDVGEPTVDATGSANGVGAAAATSATILPGAGAVAGAGAATATGQQLATVSAAVAGVGAASASSAQIAATSSAVSGIGTAAATGRGLATTAGAVAGVGAAGATSAQIAAASGAAPGVGAATGSSSSEAYVSGAGAAAGIGAAAASGAQVATASGAVAGAGSATSTGVAIASGSASAAGVGAASATGGKIATAQGAASALGVASGSSSAAAYVSAVGAADGVGAATATGFAHSAAAVGTAAGVGAAAATAQQIAATTGAVAGTGTATAASSAVNAAAGTASGIGAATAEGFEGAVVFEEAAGSANGVGTTSGIGFAIQPSAIADTRIIVAAAELRIITAAAETRTITPSAENRTIVAVAEDRTIEAVVEDRDIETSEIQRSLAA